MTNKKFFVGMAVLLSVSLFVIGCPTEAGDLGPQGNTGDAAAYAVPASIGVEGLQYLIDTYGSTRGLAVGITEVVGKGTVTFGDAKVEIATSLGTDTSNSEGVAVLNLVGAANVNLAPNAKIVLGHANDVALVDALDADVQEGGKFAVPAPVDADGNPDFSGAFVGGVTAVKNYPLGSSATPFGPGSSLQVFVYGDLTITATSVAPTAGTVVAIGNVKLTGNNATALADATKVDVSAGVISIVGDAATVTVTLPTTIAGYRFNLSDGKKLQVSGTTSIGADVRGNGTLELKGAVTVANIAGLGRIDFNPTVEAATAFSAASHAIRAQSVKFTKGFTTPLTAATNTLTLKGDVTVPKDAVIGFGVANGVFTLEKGSALWNTESTAVKLLTADKDVTVKGNATTTTLTVTVAGIAQGGTAAHTVTITGEATLGKGATYTVASESGKKGTLTLDTGAILTLEADGTAPANLVLTGAAVAANAATLGGAGKVVAGKTEITGGNASGTWTAVGAATDVTISPDTIATGAGTALTAAGHADAAVTVTAGTLTLTGVVAVATGPLGKVVLKGAADDGGAKLAGAGKVTLGNASITGGASGSWQAVGATTSIALSATAITGTGTNPVLKAADPTADTAVISLAKGNSNGDAAALAVTNATIDLSAKGAVEFPYVATTAATLVLKGGSTTLGALKLGAGEVTNTNAFLKDATGGKTVAITGTGAVIKGASAEAGAVAGLISGGTTVDTNDATITGQTSSNTVTVKADATLVAVAVTS